MGFDLYAAKFQELGGIVESWIEGEHKRTPSVQMRGLDAVTASWRRSRATNRADRAGRAVRSSWGAGFRPMRRIDKATGRKPENRAVLQAEGVLRRFSIDGCRYVLTMPGVIMRSRSICQGWHNASLSDASVFALTAGRIDDETGIVRTPLGQERCYRATDNLVDERLRRLIPEDLMDILVERNLHFAETTQKGVVFSLISALSEHGKLGLVAIADTPKRPDISTTRRSIYA